MICFVATLGIIVGTIKLLGLWPFSSPLFPGSDFTRRNLSKAKMRIPDDSPQSGNVRRFLLSLMSLVIVTFTLTEIAIQITGHWRESDQERWFIPFTLYAVMSSAWVIQHFFRAPRSFGGVVNGLIGFCISLGTLWMASDFYGNFIVPKFVHPEMRRDMEISFGRAASQKTNFSNSETMVRFEQNVIEDLALQMLVAIRDKEDAKLKALATDSGIKGWRDALPQFALEMRERFLQMTGKQFTMFPGESLVEDDFAAVKCSGPTELNGVYLVLFYTKTSDGWKNCSLRNSSPTAALAQHFDNFKKEIQKLKPGSSRSEQK